MTQLQAQPQLQPQPRPQRILVVDDNPTNRDILDMRLKANGYEVLHAGDGEEALAAAIEHRPDLILLDVMMPKMNGIEVCRRLKADPALPFMPIVLVTARADSQDVVEGLEAGADEYLTKPVDQKALVARVKALLRLKVLHETKQAAAAAAKPAVPEKPTGTDLFLSYSRQDRPKIEILSGTLEQIGWTVWWDRQIMTGTSYDKVIENALMNARAVIVAWSNTSVESDWVRAEAAFALKRSKLLPIRLDDAAPPLRFTHIHSINFSKWEGSRSDQAWEKLFADLAEMIGKPAGI
jgi:DNA-binding response OmpR family regulator